MLKDGKRGTALCVPEEASSHLYTRSLHTQLWAEGFRICIWT